MVFKEQCTKVKNQGTCACYQNDKKRFKIALAVLDAVKN